MYLLACRGVDKSKYHNRVFYSDRTNKLLQQAGAYEPKYLPQAVTMFENMLSFGNHLRMFSEEINRSGEQLGNTPQAFSHLALISAAFNLDRTLGRPN